MLLPITFTPLTKDTFAFEIADAERLIKELKQFVRKAQEETTSVLLLRPARVTIQLLPSQYPGTNNEVHMTVLSEVQSVTTALAGK